LPTTPTSTDIICDHNYIIRDTGNGRVIYTSGAGVGDQGTQGCDDLGQTFGNSAVRVSNNYFIGSSSITSFELLGGFNNSNSYGTNCSGGPCPVNYGTPTTTFGIIDRNVALDDGVLADPSNSPVFIGLSSNFPAGNPVEVTNNTSTSFANKNSLDWTGLIRGANCCSPSPAGRTACTLGGF
jgi:hypothetical protein